MSEPTASARRGATRWLIRESIGVVTVAAILLGCAGRWSWWAGWALTGIYALWVAGTAVLLMPHHPALLAERATRRPERGWDQVILSLVGLLTLAAYVVAGLDARWGWSPAMPIWVQWIGGIAALAGYVLVSASMRANAWFSTVARIQTDRDHTVATGGPYRLVRHPGYVGAAAFAGAAPLLLGSWFAVPFGLITVLLLGVRTAFEDAMLLTELAGYPAYADQVRWRLIPGVW